MKQTYTHNNMEKKVEITKIRPAFHVDEEFREAARKAAEAFEQEERDLEKYKYEKI